MSSTLRARLLRAALPGLFALTLLVVVLTFSPSGRDLFRWVKDQLRVEEARGRVVDATTGAGVPGATVVVKSFASTFEPSLTGESSTGVGTTDGEGAFVVRYQRNGSTRISVRAPGYATIYRVPLGEDPIGLPTTPASPGAVVHRAETGFDLGDSSRMVSFDVARHAVAADDAGDFGFHVDPTDPTRVTVIALGSAGLADDAPPAAAHPIDPLAARCLAPEAGYVAGDTLVGNTSNTMYFARLADGVHHARLRIRVYGRGPTPAEGYRVQIESWFAAMGGRNVCESPREGEANEFAKADRGR